MKNKILISLLLIISLAIFTICAPEPEGNEEFSVSGVVIDGTTRSPLANFVVTIGFGDKSQITNELGAFSFNDIPAGTYQVSAYRPADLTTYAEVTIASLEVGGNLGTGNEEVDSVVIEVFTLTGTITGQIKDCLDNTLIADTAAATVTVFADESDPANDNYTNVGTLTVSVTGGIYTVAGLLNDPQINYTMKISAGGYIAKEIDFFLDKGATTGNEMTLNTELYSEAGTVTGYIYDNLRNPLAGATIQVYMNPLDNDYAGYVGTAGSATTDATGMFSVTGLINDPNQNYTLRISAAGFTTQTANFNFVSGLPSIEWRDGDPLLLAVINEQDPYIASVTPINFSDIDLASAVITVTFSKAIDVTNFTYQLKGSNVLDAFITPKGFKAIDDPIALTASWDATNMILTLTPDETLEVGMEYEITLDEFINNVRDADGEILTGYPVAGHGMYTETGNDITWEFTIADTAATALAVADFTWEDYYNTPWDPTTYPGITSAGHGQQNAHVNSVRYRLKWSHVAGARRYELYREVDGDMEQIDLSDDTAGCDDGTTPDDPYTNGDDGCYDTLANDPDEAATYLASTGALVDLDGDDVNLVNLTAGTMIFVNYVKADFSDIDLSETFYLYAINSNGDKGTVASTTINLGTAPAALDLTANAVALRGTYDWDSGDAGDPIRFELTQQSLSTIIGYNVYVMADTSDTVSRGPSNWVLVNRGGMINNDDNYYEDNMFPFSTTIHGASDYFETDSYVSDGNITPFEGGNSPIFDIRAVGPTGLESATMTGGYLNVADTERPDISGTAGNVYVRRYDSDWSNIGDTNITELNPDSADALKWIGNDNDQWWNPQETGGNRHYYFYIQFDEYMDTNVLPGVAYTDAGGVLANTAMTTAVTWNDSNSLPNLLLITMTFPEDENYFGDKLVITVDPATPTTNNLRDSSGIDAHQTAQTYTYYFGGPSCVTITGYAYNDPNYEATYTYNAAATADYDAMTLSFTFPMPMMESPADGTDASADFSGVLGEKDTIVWNWVDSQTLTLTLRDVVVDDTVGPVEQPDDYTGATMAIDFSNFGLNVRADDGTDFVGDLQSDSDSNETGVTVDLVVP